MAWSVLGLKFKFRELRTSRVLRKPEQWSESLRAGQGRLTCKGDVTPQLPGSSPWPLCSSALSLVGLTSCRGPGSGAELGLVQTEE